MPVDIIRQIYNVLGVFVGPSPATGFMTSSGTVASPISGVNLLNPIPRVQSASIDLSIPRQDVNQFGQLTRLSNVIVDNPEVSLNLEYLLLDGYAESILGFAASGQQSFVSGFIDGTQSEKNYFLGIAPQGTDLINYSSPNSINVAAIGNGTVSNYSLNLAVGQIPRATVTIQGNNFQTYTGSANKASPAINPYTALPIVGPQFSLPTMSGYTGVNLPACLRPGDISLALGISGSPFDYTSGVGTIRVQGLSMSVPIALDPIKQLGNPYPIARPIRFPVNCTLSIDATVGDVLQQNVANLFCSDLPVNLAFTLNNPNCARSPDNAITVWFNQAKLENRNYAASIGQNSTVRLNFSNQLGGITSNYLGQGVIFSGSYGDTPVA